MKVYIAGPITGVLNYKENFKRAEEYLRSRGCEPVNPAILDDESDYRHCINEGLKKLMECDAIYLLKGYNGSRGANLELHYAMTTGLIIMVEGPQQKFHASWKHVSVS